MKNCNTCNEFMCGDSHTDRVSEYCGIRGKRAENSHPIDDAIESEEKRMNVNSLIDSLIERIKRI